MTVASLLKALVVSAVGVVGACALALWLIPQLSLEAAYRGGTIAFLSVSGVLVGLWVIRRQRQRQH